MHCLVFPCANCTCTSYFIEITQRATHKTENHYGNEEKLDNNQRKNLNEEKIVKIKYFKEISPWLYLVEYNFINPFQVNVSLYVPLKMSGFLMFPGGIEMEHWLEMGC